MTEFGGWHRLSIYRHSPRDFDRISPQALKELGFHVVLTGLARLGKELVPVPCVCIWIHMCIYIYIYTYITYI